MKMSSIRTVFASVALLFTVLGAASAGQTVAVTGGGTTNLCINETGTFSFSAVLTGSPTTGAECTLTGPVWNWTGPNSMSSSGPSATITVSYSQPGDYTIGAGASAVYTSSCGDTPSASGSGSITVHVVGDVTQNVNRTPAAFLGWQCVSGTLTLHTTPGTYTKQVTCQYDTNPISSQSCTSDWYIVNTSTDANGVTTYTLNEIGSDGTVLNTTTSIPTICCS